MRKWCIWESHEAAYILCLKENLPLSCHMILKKGQKMRHCWQCFMKGSQQKKSFVIEKQENFHNFSCWENNLEINFADAKKNVKMDFDNVLLGICNRNGFQPCSVRVLIFIYLNICDALIKMDCWCLQIIGWETPGIRPKYLR
jgi:hypothetical protein